MSKRLAESDPAGASEPPKKRIVFEPLQLGAISNLEGLEVKTLQFQNQKLGLRLSQRAKIEEDLRQRVDQLEKRQTQDDAVINVMNRYWNQLNEDIRILLQRFDAETGDENEKAHEAEATTSFITLLATWHREELDEKLANRVQVSQRAVAKIIQVFDHLIQRNDKLCRSLRGEEKSDEDSSKVDGGAAAAANEDKDKDKKDASAAAAAASDGGDAGERPTSSAAAAASKPPPLDEQVKDLNKQLQEENKKLHALNTSLHEKNHFLSLKEAEFEERINAEETKNEELQNKVDDLEYELQKCRMRNEKLESTLVETQDKLTMYVDTQGSVDRKVVLSNAERKTVEQMQTELEEQRELASSRLAELEKTNGNFKDALKEVEKLKMELSTLPEHVVVETTEHKCLQSQFSVLYNEAMQLKTQLEEARNQLQVAKNAHMRQIEQMESEELLAQKKLRTEVIQLEDMLAQVRKEYEMLRIEFEQNLAANEQTGPINKEMRNLITSLQTHNVQLKGEIQRYKFKYKGGNLEIAKLRKDLDDMKTAEIKALQAKKEQELKKEEEEVESSEQAGNVHDSGSEDSQAASAKVKHEPGVACDDPAAGGPSGLGASSTPPTAAEGAAAAADGSPDSSAGTPAGGATPSKTEKAGAATPGTPGPAAAAATPSKVDVAAAAASTNAAVKAEAKDLAQKNEDLLKIRAKDADAIKELKTQLKKAQNDVKEMKLLLDMYKTSTREQRDKAQLMVAEKKTRAELEEARQTLKRLQETKKDEKKRLADEDATKRIKQLEDQVLQLQKQVANHRREEEALLNEMEVTGQAFEDMQEQNSRLIQQLREKDDANFKLMSERIKSNQIQRLAREDRDMLTQQVNTLTTQVEAQNQVVRKLEEKERLLQNNLATVDKELSMRQQAMEMHKRKAIESAQSAADLKLHLEKYHAQIKEVQQTVAEKTSSLEAEAYKTKRLNEELALVKRKVERLRKIEMASDMDEILKEEIREYKETLTCPSCKVKRKDAVLTKCFHCFCYDCLRTRYETRQRKCPKCNAAFGASDYHRLYLA